MRKTWMILLLAIAVPLIVILSVWGDRIEFVLGGAMVNVGYRLQDRLDTFDFEHHDEITPEQVLHEVVEQNRMSSAVRSQWPRSSHHPLVAIVACMDARLDTNELAGDTRRYYYVLRLAGSVIDKKEEDMLELAVNNGTKVVIFTTHADCAAEKVSRDPEKAKQYPSLTAAIRERKARLQEFMARPNVAAKLAGKQLLVRVMHINTDNEHFEPVELSTLK